MLSVLALNYYRPADTPATPPPPAAAAGGADANAKESSKMDMDLGKSTPGPAPQTEMRASRLKETPLKKGLILTFQQLETKTKAPLLHEVGAGSRCLKCAGCPGLDLHFWRKVCNHCGCRFEEHDVGVPETEAEKGAKVEVEPEAQKMVCAACNEPILSDYIDAEGCKWHADHFCCAGCNVSIGVRRYTLKQGKIFCLDCYMARFARVCRACRMKIPPHADRVSVASALHWHWPDCFRCAMCGALLQVDHFVMRGNETFCDVECKSKKYSTPIE